ncbi:MAG: hypothetical protein ACK533_10710 [Planctomycetota bacterium]
MHAPDDPLLPLTRRRFFGRSAASLSAAFAATACTAVQREAEASSRGTAAAAPPAGPHFQPRAKSVI